MTEPIDSLSVIIPVYNDPQGVQDTVEAILNSQFAGKLEILIVDNNSTDNTREVARSYADTHDCVRLLREDDIQSSYAARNTGIKHATGDILIFVDADITVDSDWLETVATEIEGHDYLTYDVEVYLPEGEDTIVGRHNAQTEFPIEEFAKNRDFGGGGCIAVRREVFEDIGLFDYRLISGGDVEFGNRVVNSGREIHFTPNARVYHPARTSLKSKIKQQIRIGRGFCQLQRYYPDRYGRPGIPPRPAGDGKPEDKSALTQGERIAFWVLNYFFLGCRGLGYFLECISGESRKKADAPGPLSDE